jgi:hypothetical protein
VISDFAAAIRFKHRHVSLLQLFRVEQYGRTVATAPDRERVRMFEQQQRVRPGSELYGLFGFLLDRQPGWVISQPAPLDQKLSFAVHTTKEYS